MKYDKEIEEKKKEIKNLKNGQDKRKQRVHHLIKKGALLEMANIDNENDAVLLGYFIYFKELSDNKKEKLKQKGKEYFENRELSK